jgi:hypothetical protein
LNDDIFRFLSLGDKLPLRLDSEQVAWLLNCEEQHVTFLIAERLLKPLGKPPQNSKKFFSTAKVLERRSDESWLAKVSDAIHGGWKKKNATRKRSENIPNGTLGGRQCSEAVFSR